MCRRVAQSREMWLYWPSDLATKDRWGPKLEATQRCLKHLLWTVSGESVEHHQSGRLYRLESAEAEKLHAQVCPLGVALVGEHSHSNSAARYAQLLVFHPL
jgi:hypothetical protein